MKNRRHWIPSHIAPAKPFCPATPSPLPPPPEASIDPYESDTAADDWPAGVTLCLIVVLVFWPVCLAFAPLIWLYHKSANER